VRAVPGAAKNRIAGEHDGALKVAVAAVADRGKANRELADFLSEVLEVRRAQVELVSGEKNRRKEFRIGGVTIAAIAARLRALGVECDAR
jgi:uncharacterized protein